ncbi:MAG: respiratory nitrate reductase subunit gamma [Acidobacteriota bacterium]|nr:respiratory nitrate reductase subunit gamma [Acidobacteriota bacterium]
MKTLLWIVFPYICLTSFLLGHVWRYKYDKFGWTSRSSELYEKRILSWASPLFHFGILGVLAGHLVGLLVPENWTNALGISEHTYHLAALVMGTLAGLAAATGLALLIYRRRTTPSVFRVTSVTDKVMYPLLGIVVALGLVNTIGVNLLGMGGYSGGYNYRLSVAVWFRDVFLFHPSTTTMSGAPWSFQAHALFAMLLIGAWPYTRLVHVLAAPVGYFYRPYIVYRSREPLGAARQARRGWERMSQPDDAGR